VALDLYISGEYMIVDCSMLMTSKGLIELVSDADIGAKPRVNTTEKL
jgi:hypothetical protein